VWHFWFQFTYGIEVWELLFHDVETRMFCITWDHSTRRYEPKYRKFDPPRTHMNVSVRGPYIFNYRPLIDVATTPTSSEVVFKEIVRFALYGRGFSYSCKVKYHGLAL